MKHFELKGQVREAGNKATIKAFRKQGLVPCNLYGNGVQSKLFTVTEKELNALINTPASYIVDLVLSDGTKQTAIVHELQFHPVADNCLHVDFFAVNEEKPVAIKVPVTISGHAVGVQKGGKFVKRERELRISAMMKDLPDSVNIDITELEIGKVIVAGDLHYDNISILTPKDTFMCGVKATRASSK